MTELPAWIIARLEEERRLREQENQYEQLRLPLYEEPPREPERDEPKGPIVIEL